MPHNHQLVIAVTHQHHVDLLHEAHVGRQAHELRHLRRLIRARHPNRQERGASSGGRNPAIQHVATIS